MRASKQPSVLSNKKVTFSEIFELRRHYASKLISYEIARNKVSKSRQMANKLTLFNDI